MPAALPGRSPELPPDLVLFVTDQQRADQYGFAGGWVTTPAIDRLAAAGVVFDQAYSTSTTCVPARVGLLTGLLHNRVRTGPGTRALAEGEWTIARALRAQGYQTALVGKMHFTPIRADHGFDTLRICEDVQATSGYSGADVDDYHEWLTSVGIADWREGHSGVAAATTFPHDASVHPTGWIAREAIEVLARRDPDRPLLLVVSFPNPHAPYNPPEPYASLVDPADVVVPAHGFELNAALPAVFREPLEASRGRIRDPEGARRTLCLVGALIRHIDDAVGEVVERLDLSRTLVALTADHGDYGGNRGLLRKTPWIPFDDLARVALVVAGAGVVGGRRVAGLVQSADVAPTFLEVAGADVPDGLDTCSLVPVLAGGGAPEDRVVLSATNDGWPMARRGALKMIVERRSGEGLILDLGADPLETVDARDVPGRDDEIRSLYRELLTRVSRPAPELPALR